MEIIKNKIRVLVVDDSAFMRKIISDILSADPRIEVVGTARNGEEGLANFNKLNPDVLTLDIEMPRMNGLELLSALMDIRPVPVIMVSSVTHEGAEITMKALSAGAVDFVTKPSGTISLDMEKVGDELRQKVLMASRISNRTVADMVRKPPRKNDSPSPQPVESRQAVPSSVPKRVLLKKIDMVVIASSTGGPRALQEIIPAIKKKFPVPILVVQHMPVGFTAPFAQRLNEMSQLEVVEGAEGLKIQRGVAVIAPGGYHMTVERKMGELYCHLLDTPPVRSVKPAADVLFTSVAEVVGGSVLAVVLTGMGRDGTDGARVLKEKGAYVLAEAKETCVVYGMPQSVVEAGLVDEVLPLGSISTGLERLVSVNAVSAAGLP